MRHVFPPVVLLLLSLTARAAMVEEQIDVPVRVALPGGRVVAHTLKVTVYSDPANPRPAPILLISHGRSPDAAGRASFGRARYPQAASFFVQRGFIIAAPTRIGYGVTGGEDVEDSGPCDRKVYAPAYDAAAQQAIAVLEALRERPGAAKDRTVLVGQSFGGMATVALAALNPAGVQAAISFAGGGGGDAKTRPHDPCSPQRLEALFRDYGRTARVPMLWVYAENDSYFGPELPRQWFRAYAAAGAPAQFVQYPPFGAADGHALFGAWRAVWQDRVGEFLDAQGFPARLQ